MSDCYKNWMPTDANVQAVADDESAFPIMRSLAKELIIARTQLKALQSNLPNTKAKGQSKC